MSLQWGQYSANIHRSAEISLDENVKETQMFEAEEFDALLI